MTDRIKFVVQDENVFGYVDPRQPTTLCILATSIIRGSIYTWQDGPIILHEGRYRPATRADFDTYRVSVAGYDVSIRSVSIRSDVGEPQITIS